MSTHRKVSVSSKTRRNHPDLNTRLLISRSLTSNLLKFYDYPHPLRPTIIIKGYDKLHAFRTARMCAAVASQFGHSPERLKQYHIACLLHDLGRAGLDQKLFGKIWSWATQHGIPTRPREWRSRFPNTPYGKESQSFLKRFGPDLKRQGIRLDSWTREQIDMRLGFAQRLRKQLRIIMPELKRLGVKWTPWMERIMLYYYYPEKLSKSHPWIRQLAEILVACEQLEAYSNNRRGRDYYARTQERFSDAFEYLTSLQSKRMVSQEVIETIRRLTSQGAFTQILESARGTALHKQERHYLQTLTTG